ncbi:hypothetical protein JZ751_017127 [Albula glossodonta]|uniref:Uncharacterized protein n=1 Tax=Albula glossodonta TaxID=121402 RepID=A0A8T2NXI4_9TELE|nr:hypothetical protein JZ751_017127 [Albula glossodonta]
MDSAGLPRHLDEKVKGGNTAVGVVTKGGGEGLTDKPDGHTASKELRCGSLELATEGERQQERGREREKKSGKETREEQQEEKEGGPRARRRDSGGG